MNSQPPRFPDPLAATAARLGPTLILPKGLAAGEIMAFHTVAKLLGTTDRAQFRPVDAETLQACVRAAIDEIDVTAIGGDRRTIRTYSGRPAQTYNRLLQLAAICILQADAVAAAVEATAQNVNPTPPQLPADCEARPS